MAVTWVDKNESFFKRSHKSHIAVVDGGRDPSIFECD